jgi:hypothetical protein
LVILFRYLSRLKKLTECGIVERLCDSSIKPRRDWGERGTGCTYNTFLCNVPAEEYATAQIRTFKRRAPEIAIL